MIRDNAVKIALTSENDQELFEDAVVATDERAELPPAKKNKLKLPPPIARKTYREWNVEELFSHPRQAELPATTAAEDAALLDDIRRNGMLEPIEILPDGTIISGHRRWAAAQQLDRPSVRVIVRNDLAAQGQVAVERRYLEANLNRRQLSKHDAIVLYVRLRQLSPRGRERRGLGSLRNEVAERYQMSGRNLDRWASVFEGPQEIRQAVMNKQLPLTKAVRLLTDLDEQQLVEVVAQLHNGADPQTVAREAARQVPRKTKSVNVNLPTFQKWLNTGFDMLGTPEQLSRLLDEENDEQSSQRLEQLQGEITTFMNARGEPQRRKKRRPK